MKAITFTSPGPPPIFEQIDIQEPVPRDDEVLLKVHAVSVNSWDWELTPKRPSMVYLGKRSNPAFRIMGADVAGTVTAVGTQVKRFKPGDEVFGDLCESGWGGYAEYVCAMERALILKPPTMTFEEAAATPQAGLLAFQGYRKYGTLGSGQMVLINGAGGGVGSFAIQMAKFYGANVTGVDSAAKLEFMSSLGADHVIDYRKDDFSKGRSQYDFILDMKGSRSVSDYKRSLRPGGKCFLVGGKPSRLLMSLSLGSFESKKLKLVLYKPNKYLDDLVRIIETGKVKPKIDRTYPLSEVGEAVRNLGAGHVKGKAVITVA
jgi:NADPH:quinone reductase-like Zn-dependent oxidoreductase